MLYNPWGSSGLRPPHFRRSDIAATKKFRIVRREVGASEVEVKCWLAVRFVHRV